MLRMAGDMIHCQLVRRHQVAPTLSPVTFLNDQNNHFAAYQKTHYASVFFFIHLLFYILYFCQ